MSARDRAIASIAALKARNTDIATRTSRAAVRIGTRTRQNATRPPAQIPMSHGSAIATRGTEKRRSESGQAMAINAPHARSSAIWLIAPAVAAPSRAAKRVPRWNSRMTPAVQRRHHHGAEQRVGAELMNAQVPIPAREGHHAVDVGRQGSENGRRRRGQRSGARSVPRGRGRERAADDDVGQRDPCGGAQEAGASSPAGASQYR